MAEEASLIPVDSFLIPQSEVADYIFDREVVAEIVTTYYKACGLLVSRDFKGSEKGEAVVGSNTKGLLVKRTYLNPTTISYYRQSESKESFIEDYIKNKD